MIDIFLKPGEECSHFYVKMSVNWFFKYSNRFQTLKKMFYSNYCSIFMFFYLKLLNMDSFRN